MRKSTRFAALLLALMLPLSGALAFASAGYEGLSLAYEKGQALRLELGAQLRVWKALSPGSLPALRDWLEDARLRLELSREAERAALERQGESLLALSFSEKEGVRRLTLENESLAFETRGSSSPLALLTEDGEAGFDRLLRLPGPEIFQDLPKELLSELGPYEEAVKRSRTIGQLGVSPGRVEYRLDAEAWQALWPKAQNWLSERLGPLPPGSGLSGLRFQKGAIFRRFLDAQGEPLGWQMEGEALLPSGLSHRISLLCGRVRGKGLTLSLKAPALRGEGDFSLSLSASLKKESLEAKISLSDSLGDESRRLKGEARLKLSQEGEAQRLTGRLRLEDRRGAFEEKLSLEPDLLLRNGGIEGSLELLREKGGKPWLDLRVEGGLWAGEASQAPEAVIVHDLDGSIGASRGVFEKALLKALRGMLMSFPQSARPLLEHDIGREARTQGDPLPAPAGSPDFIVTDTDEGGTL